jgi:hypothetical protein
MKNFHLSVSPWWAPGCTRTVAFSEVLRGFQLKGRLLG